MIVTGNAHSLKKSNRSRIVEYIRSHPDTSRVELAEALALSRSAVGKLVEELIRESWLCEMAATGGGGPGRRAVPLRVDTSRKLLIGANVDGRFCESLALSLNGEMRELTRADTQGSPHDALDVLADQIAGLYRKLSPRHDIIGIGVAAPGPVHPQRGILHHADSAGWRNVPLLDMLRERLHALGLPRVPLVIKRAVACLAAQHFEFEHQDDEQPLVYVHVGRTLAVAGLSGEVLQGYNGLAGYVAHMKIEPDGALCACGQRGCANVVLTLRAIEEALDSDLATLRTLGALHAPETLAVIRRVGQKLGTFIFNLILQYDPARVLIGGPAFQLGKEYLQSIQDQIQALSEAAGLQPPAVQIHRYEKRGFAIGAATMALHEAMLQFKQSSVEGFLG